MTASRHLACKVCRDRKVRCDGGRPSCEKCLQSGENCVYVSPARLSKVDLIENIASLQERLANAESRLEEIPPCFNSSSSSSPPTTSAGLLSPFVSDVDTAKSPANLQPPSYTLNCSKPWMGTPASTSTLCPTATTATEVGLGESNIFPWCMSFLPTADEVTEPPTGLSLPSLREVRAWNEQSMGGHEDNPDACTVLRELTILFTTISTNQAHITGISKTIADYMAWARQAPNVNQSSTLEILETRVREVANLAATWHWLAFHDLQKSLGKSETFRQKLGLLEKELMSGTSEIAYFFSTQYNIQSELSHQRSITGYTHRCRTIND